jgi:hypothetical protein
LLYFSRTLRNLKEMIKYPIWILRGKPAPDNQFYKIQRICAIGKKYSCVSFVETGTFYGQTINAVRNDFEIIHSIELFETLYHYNKKAFSKNKNVTIHFGDSSAKLKEAIQSTKGRILFWLDGHFSGVGTARGNVDCPILAELNIIKSEAGQNHCILIDDARLFKGAMGYPKLESLIQLLLEIDPTYQTKIDRDCIVAFPSVEVEKKYKIIN